MPLLRRRVNHSGVQEESERVGSGEVRDDSCPVLGEDKEASTRNQRQRIHDVRRIDNGAFSPRRSVVQRIRSRKNRFMQRVLVACHLAEPSRDLTFDQAQISNRAAIEQLTTIRSGLSAHSQSILNLSMAICCFTGNSARLLDDSQASQVNVVVEGQKIRECSFIFSDQVEKTVLVKIDYRINDLKRVDALIGERAKVALEVEYMKRMLDVEQQKGNANRIAERKQALQATQLECERATRFIAQQIKFLTPRPDADLCEILQEYAQLAAQFFKRGAGFLGSTTKTQ